MPGLVTIAVILSGPAGAAATVPGAGTMTGPAPTPTPRHYGLARVTVHLSPRRRPAAAVFRALARVSLA